MPGYRLSDCSNTRTANEFGGSQVGSQPRQGCGDAGRRPATVFAGQYPSARCLATSGDRPASFASRGSGVQIPSAPLGNVGQDHHGPDLFAFEDHLSLRCHPDRAGTGDTGRSQTDFPSSADIPATRPLLRRGDALEPCFAGRGGRMNRRPLRPEPSTPGDRWPDSRR
jgi:hypothetical protein